MTRVLTIVVIALFAVGCARGATPDVVDAGGACDDPDCGLQPDVDVDGGIGPDTLPGDASGCTDLWYVDADGDGFGDAEKDGVPACAQPAGYSAVQGDCDDGDADSYPGAPETPGDGVDQDCDGAELCYEDRDNDGRRAPEAGVVPSEGGLDCQGEGELPAGAPATDCDDDDPAVYGGADEICDGVDNDCDGVPDGPTVCPCPLYENLGSRYLFCETVRQWPEARNLCQGYGYALVTVDDAQEDLWIAGQMASVGIGEVWLGASDGQTEGVFVWIDGSPVLYANWREDEPNDRGSGPDGGADCVARLVGRDPGWADRSCADEYGFVCELPEG
jgi:hypothetical protein